MPFLHPRSSSVDSPITFSQERGQGAFAPLNTLPRCGKPKRSLFHIPDDDDNDNDRDDPPNDPPPQRPSLAPPTIPFPRSGSPLSLSPTDSHTSSTPPLTPSPPRSNTTSSVVLSSGKPLKSSLKSSSSSSLADDAFPNRALHTRAQSMPSTPAYDTTSGGTTPKNVHFKADDAGLATVRLFKRTGRPRAVSNQDDTETETEPEHGFPFPVFSSSFSTTNGPPVTPLMEIDVSPSRTSAIPAPSATPYANIHLESVSLPPARPPVLRGTVLVRNLSFEKQVGVRFTLDDWTTVSEVLATYTASVSPSEALFHPLPTAAAHVTVGDLVARPPLGVSQDSTTPTEAPTNQWDRFSFSIRLEDYEARLTDRTLWLVARYTAPGVGEWWDNNEHQNYKVAFRPRPSSATATISEHKRGASAPVPSSAPFLANAAPSSASVVQRQPPRTFQRPPALARSSSTPSQPTVTLGRLALKHYAAPASPVSPPKVTVARDSSPPKAAGGSPTSPLRIQAGHFMTNYEVARASDKDGAEVEQVEDIARDSERDKEGGEVDEGFETGSEDDEPIQERKTVVAPTPTRKPPLQVNIKPPTPIPTSKAIDQRRDSPPMLSARAPFSPTRESPVPFASLLSAANSAGPAQGPNAAAVDPVSGDSNYAALIREWCFAHGQNEAAGVTPGAAWGGGGMGAHAHAATGGGNMLWVGMGG